MKEKHKKDKDKHKDHKEKSGKDKSPHGDVMRRSSLSWDASSSHSEFSLLINFVSKISNF